MVFQEVEEGNPTSILPKANAAPGAAPEPGRRKLELLLEQMSTRWRQATFWIQVPLQGHRSRIRFGVDFVLGRTHSKHPEVWSYFLGTWNFLLQDTSCQTEDRNVPSACLGGLAAWFCGSVFRMLEGIHGLQNALGSSRGRSRDPASICVES